MPYAGLPEDAEILPEGLPEGAQLLDPQGQPIIDVTAGGEDMSVAEKMNNPYFGIDTPEELRAEIAKEKPVPKWGEEHPNLYGLYGAAKGVGAAVVEGGGAAAGTALGAASPVPGGAIIGGGAGYAAGKRAASALGLSDEPMDNSAMGIGKDVALGAAFGAVPGIARFAAKGARMLPGGETGMNLLTKVPVGLGMFEKAKLPDLSKFAADIDTGLAKAIRPGVAGNRTATQSANYAEDARTAVNEIVLNKDNLGLVDDFGEAIDDLPKTLPQFRQAIDSTKNSIWQRVEAINAAAGEAGAEVPLRSAVDELNALATKPAYRTMSPETVNYAVDRAKSLGKQGVFSIGDAQDALTLANQSAKNFYQNPLPDTASRAYVDSLVANHIRANMDAALEAATGSPAAAQLRKAYGALKTIEKDVNQRAVVDARKNAKGLVDFTDIYTAGELISAMATMNPVGAAKAGTMAAVKAFIKRENNPNTHVERVFKLADKLVSKKDFPLPQAAPKAPVPVQQPPWAGKVNTGGIVQPGPQIQTMTGVNTGGIVQPALPRQQLLDPLGFRLGNRN